jgi:Arc/MetJ-type ribon-helix-helix transcriptional regulator
MNTVNASRVEDRDVERMANDDKPSRDLRLPARVCEDAEKLIQGTRFSSLEEFVTFLLRELTANKSAQLDARERKVIEDRLRDLGYL